MNTNIMNTQILKVRKGHFYVYFNLNLCSYGQLFVLVFKEILLAIVSWFQQTSWIVMEMSWRALTVMTIVIWVCQVLWQTQLLIEISKINPPSWIVTSFVSISRLVLPSLFVTSLAAISWLRQTFWIIVNSFTCDEKW